MPAQSATPVSTVGGTSSPRMLEQWPTLAGYGIAMTVFDIDGCALRPPHVHQRASGMLTVISGSNLTVHTTEVYVAERYASII